MTLHDLKMTESEKRIGAYIRVPRGSADGSRIEEIPVFQILWGSGCSRAAAVEGERTNENGGEKLHGVMY